MGVTTSTLIVGAGPIGLELAVALKLLGEDYIQVEANQIGHTISWYPRQVQFFSSPDRIAIAGVPLQTVDQTKATGEQYLTYLRQVVEQFDLPVQTYQRVTQIQPKGGFLGVTSRCRGQDIHYRARHVVVAIGDLHEPRKLAIEGEDLPHVSHYFDEAHRYFRQRLLIVGGRNSAVEAAIRCQRAGAQVAISYRGTKFDTNSVKYWLAPEIEMLIQTGRIGFYPQTSATRITPSQVTLEPVGGGPAHEVESDAVLLMVGYEMDMTLLEDAGVHLEGPNRSPTFNPATMQTNVAGLFVAGTAAGGTQVRFRLFIENCHPHVVAIVQAITGRPPPFDCSLRTHSHRYSQPES